MVNITASYLRDHTAEVWDMASREPIMVENAGKPIAVILSPEEYSKLKGMRRREPGSGKHLFEGVDIDKLLCIPIPGIEEYMPQ